ncbi:lipoma-preferred partner homolog isoform X2 [Amphiura filiformis]|uniref:lipoma-preferred partner homolog isoform X2 n=1 Tax=Amphiura filiformis TaxID=82378 RepID=UPI003B2238BF
MTTMAKLEQELLKLDEEREALRGPGSQYTKTTVTSRSIYQSEPRKYRPVSPPKSRAPGSLPPSGPHKGAPPPTLPKPYRKPTDTSDDTASKGLPTYAPVSYADDLPPPPPPTGGAYHMPADDPLPPPPPELTHGSPYGVSNDPLPPPPPLNPYNEPRPPVQAYKQPSYQQKPSGGVKMNGAQAAPKPVSKPATARTPEYYVPKPTDQPIMAPDKSGTEAEIDALTSLLVQNMDSGLGQEEGEFFGMCARCGNKVIGENKGCTAMEQVYHIDCFTCDTCHTKLRGQPFYSLENKSYCENCYVNSLEKCSTCSKPITDRILRATGKPYHPECFTCVVCGKSLDGVPFTVDATNQIHCIEDFHKKFAPRCSVCLQPIMPDPGKEETVRIVALDRSFHTGCYKCEDCHIQLSSEADGRGCYPLDDHILCRDCNTKRVQALTASMK